jgi:hypothetical protein
MRKHLLALLLVTGLFSTLANAQQTINFATTASNGFCFSSTWKEVAAGSSYWTINSPSTSVPGSGGDQFIVQSTGQIYDATANVYLTPNGTSGVTTTTLSANAESWSFAAANSSFTDDASTIYNCGSIIYAYPDGANGDGGWPGYGPSPYISGDYKGTEHSALYHDASTCCGTTTFTGVSSSVFFSGTGITWIGKKGPNYGIATYAIDGGKPVAFDAYNSLELDQNPNVTVSGLLPGSHVMTISVTASKNGASSNYYQTIDAFQIQGSTLPLSQATTFVSPCTSPTLESYAYAVPGSPWVGGCARDGGDGSDGPGPAGHIVANNAGNYILVPFTGSLVVIVGRPDFEDGEMQVTIDNDTGATQTVNLQAGNSDYDAFNNMVIYAAKLSTGGPHTILIQPTDSGAPNTDPKNYIQIQEVIAFN